MQKSRRSFLLKVKTVLVLGAATLFGLPGKPLAKPGSDKPSPQVGLDRIVGTELGGAKLENSDRIKLEVPDIAEDGAIVPISVETDLPDVSTLWIFAEKNPNPLAARFHYKSRLDAFLSLRIKLNDSGDVLAVVKSGDAFFSARRKVRVVVGGCG